MKQDSVQPMELDELVYAISFMSTATTEMLQAMVSAEYHDFLDVFDPETPLSCLPPVLIRV
jgi:hypothetical protein